MAFFAIDCDDVDVMATMMIAAAAESVAAAAAVTDCDADGGGVDDDDVVRMTTTMKMTMIHLPMPAFHLMHCRHYLLIALV